MRRILPESKTSEIIRLAKEGLDRQTIARRVGCSLPNVYKTLTRHDIIARPSPRPWNRSYISALREEELVWLKAEARRINTPWRDLARAMLLDAIEEARNGNG